MKPIKAVKAWAVVQPPNGHLHIRTSDSRADALDEAAGYEPRARVVRVEIRELPTKARKGR